MTKIGASRFNSVQNGKILSHVSVEDSISSSAIILLKKGDESSFKKIYDQLSDFVYSIAIRFLKDESSSEEIVQDVFLRLWQNREKLNENGNLTAYLYIIAKRLCLNRLREARRSSESFEKLISKIDQISECTQEQIFYTELNHRLTQAISLLPERQKNVFQLSRMEDLSHKEIAHRLNISPNTVKNHIVEAIKALKKTLNDVDYVSRSLLFVVISLFF